MVEEVAKRPETDEERVALIHAGANAAIEALTDELKNALNAAKQYPDTFTGTLWGDHIDYTNAALDQLRYCLTLLQEGPLDDLDRIFAASRDTLEDGDDDAAGFIYGYADHRSPISDLMAANNEED